jgi:hypothetical protein
MEISKLLKVFLGVVLIGLVLLGIFSLFSRDKDAPSSIVGEGLPTVVLRPTLRPTEIFENPGAERLVIGGVEVNNFYNGLSRTNPEGDTLIVDRENYQVVYFPSSESFAVTVLGSSFNAVRGAAEEEFLRILDVDSLEACRLEVVISTPFFANPEIAGESFGLSFCE